MLNWENGLVSCCSSAWTTVCIHNAGPTVRLDTKHTHSYLSTTMFTRRHAGMYAHTYTTTTHNNHMHNNHTQANLIN